MSDVGIEAKYLPLSDHERLSVPLRDGCDIIGDTATELKQAGLWCCICDSVYVDPVSCPHCGKMMCRADIVAASDVHSSSAPRCPYTQCAAALARRVPTQRDTEDRSGALTVRCNHCRKQMTRSSFLSHYNEACVISCKHGCKVGLVGVRFLFSLNLSIPMFSVCHI
jgi:hypothetical protein